MINILNSALNGNVILVEVAGTCYQVNLYWPDDKELCGMDPPEVGTQMVYPYEPTETATSLEIAWKWGPWEEGFAYDNELEPPEEIVTMVKKAFSDFIIGKGYQP